MTWLCDLKEESLRYRFKMVHIPWIRHCTADCISGPPPPHPRHDSPAKRHGSSYNVHVDYTSVCTTRLIRWCWSWLVWFNCPSAQTTSWTVNWVYLFVPFNSPYYSTRTHLAGRKTLSSDKTLPSHVHVFGRLILGFISILSGKKSQRAVWRETRAARAR